MTYTTVELPDHLYWRLSQEAMRRGVSISDLTCSALEAHLSDPATRPLTAAGAGHSGQSDLSERIEEILAGDEPKSVN